MQAKSWATAAKSVKLRILINFYLLEGKIDVAKFFHKELQSRKGKGENALADWYDEQHLPDMGALSTYTIS